jgi:hypothetical protein
MTFASIVGMTTATKSTIKGCILNLNPTVLVKHRPSGKIVEASQADTGSKMVYVSRFGWCFPDQLDPS